MVTGSGWWAMPWLIPAALVVVCLVVVGIFGYLARELLFTGRRDAADELELRVAQRWFGEVRDQERYEDPAAAWASFLTGERERMALEADDVDEDLAAVDVDEDLAAVDVDEDLAAVVVDEDLAAVDVDEDLAAVVVDEDPAAVVAWASSLTDDLAEPDPDPCWCGRRKGHIFAAAIDGGDVDAEFATVTFEAVS